jgi:hypothetical protein
MNIVSWISSSSILVIIILSLYVLYIINQGLVEQSTYLVNNNQCLDTDANGNPIFISNQGAVDDRLCIFNSLLISDPVFRESVLSLYSPGKMLLAIENLSSGKWPYPSTKLVQEDPILSTMILNQWFSSDDALNSHRNVMFSNTLNFFVVDGKTYSNFDNSGLNLSSYIDKNGNPIFYIFMDNNVVIELPIQLFIYNLPVEQQKNQRVKIKGIWKILNVPPIKITDVESLKSILTDKFYNFKDTQTDGSFRKSCLGLNPDEQKQNDNNCKFFTSDSIGGIVTVLKRVVVVPMQNDAIVSDYISYVENKVINFQQITLLEFFLLLAMKSHRDSITYDFKLDKTI